LDGLDGLDGEGIGRVEVVGIFVAVVFILLIKLKLVMSQSIICKAETETLLNKKVSLMLKIWPAESPVIRVLDDAISRSCQ
jgi:hypothetical protein